MALRDKCSKKRVVLTCLVLAVLVAIITPIAYYATRPKEEDPTPPTSKPSEFPQPQSLSQRINCIPEAKGGVVKASRALCHERGCNYNASGTLAPACFFPVHEEHGFVVLGSEIITPLGYKLRLKRKGRSPFGRLSPEFNNPTLLLEKRGPDVLRFMADRQMRDKVIPMCRHAQQATQLT